MRWENIKQTNVTHIKLKIEELRCLHIDLESLIKSSNYSQKHNWLIKLIFELSWNVIGYLVKTLQVISTHS